MAQKRTKADKLQRNVERLEARDDARREPEIRENQSESARAISDPTELEERIRVRAYELYEARGHEHGHDREDWLQAEGEILGPQRKAAA
jgi:hypothetical protein